MAESSCKVCQQPLSVVGALFRTGEKGQGANPGWMCHPCAEATGLFSIPPDDKAFTDLFQKEP